ncbi:MAG: hypothetical protein A3F10_05135 [Coxiella sp. RIFCSPHIGHO2_12_FULL_42_15]|nr:MAG: hypothetical protein A3F10_05135 [Coxiella sp. RIFCSPHIGHO2_12_FULL_42_15]
MGPQCCGNPPATAIVAGGLWACLATGALSVATLGATATAVTFLAIAWPAAIALTAVGAGIVLGVGIYAGVKKYCPGALEAFPLKLR